MKNKRKPEFLEELRSWLIAVSVVAIIMVFLISVASLLPLPHERYQAVFDDCIAADTLTAEQCHDIALAVVG